MSLEAGDAERIGRYLALLLDENTRMNLTAIRDPEAAWERHALDALSLLGVISQANPPASPIRIADVGTGGGVPGMILALALPDAQITLIDSTAKKTAFLQRAADELGLSNVRVVTARAESAGAYPRGELRDSFDVVVARAVARISILAELCVPLAREGALIAMIKGQRADDEMLEAKQALYELHAGHVGTVDTPTGKIIVLEKSRRTPKKYPRPPGEPNRNPIGGRLA